MITTLESKHVNGINVDALTQTIDTIAADPAKGQSRWQVTSRIRRNTCSRL
jgi:hypothetical protein